MRQKEKEKNEEQDFFLIIFVHIAIFLTDADDQRYNQIIQKNGRHIV